MAPKPKVSKDTIINSWYEMRRQRADAGVKNPERGLHAAVGKLYGFEGQYVGRVIKAYRKKIAEEGGIEPITEPNEPIKTEPNRFEAHPLIEPIEPIPRGREPVRPKTIKGAKEQWNDAIPHQQEDDDFARSGPKRGGETAAPGNIDITHFNQLQDQNKLLEERLQQLEGMMATIKIARAVNGGGSSRSSPRQEQILEVLSDGKARSYVELQTEIGWAGNIRPAVIQLVREGKVDKIESREWLDTRKMNVPRYTFKISKKVKDLM